MVKRRSDRRARRQIADATAAAAPALWIDGAVAALLLCMIAFLSRTTLTPDGVAYFENAELFARGQWSEAIQGYWSPGYSMLLAPLVWIAGDDRALFLTIAHLLQTVLGVLALWLSALAVRARVPALAQRPVFWACAVVVLRWLTPEVLTPDLLLCVLLLLFVVRMPATRGARGQIVLGALAGVGFLVKTSIWPSLVVAVAVAAARALQRRESRAFPSIAVGTGALIVASFVALLSIRAGTPTLGSVGPLNARWYLGDLDRRTPDNDRGPHATKGTLRLPGGAAIPFHDLRGSTRTYLPWSNPERWAAGVPTSAAPTLGLQQAASSWRANGIEFAKWVLPLALGLLVLFRFLGGTQAPASFGVRLLERPLLLTGASSVLTFMAVHAETRLLAPAVLLILLGVWTKAQHIAPHSRYPWVAGTMTAALLLQLLSYVIPLKGRLTENAASETERHRYLDEQLARRPVYGAIIVGPATSWMSALWRHHMHVALQIGGEAKAQMRALTEAERLQWLHDQFENEVLGVGEAVVTVRNGALHTEWVFTAW